MLSIKLILINQIIKIYDNQKYINIKPKKSYFLEIFEVLCQLLMFDSILPTLISHLCLIKIRLCITINYLYI
jgi:hypothetical protein